MKKKRILKVILILTGIALCCILLAEWSINSATKKFLYSNVQHMPVQKAGLLLGTSRLTANGYLNQFFQHRINAAVELYKAGKIKYIIVSGDNSRANYNEPKDMKEELVKAGIPADHIFEDYAGFRTFDSVVRCKEIFGQDSVTIISQQFHNERAIYLAQRKGIYAIGYNAPEVKAYNGFRTKLRERLARVKLFVDLLLNQQPKFLGEKVVLP
jgi:SanA protein